MKQEKKNNSTLEKIVIGILTATFALAGAVTPFYFYYDFRYGPNMKEQKLLKKIRHDQFMEFGQLILNHQISEISGKLVDVREIEIPMYFYREAYGLFSIANTSTSIGIKNQILYIKDENDRIVSLLSLNPMAYRVGDPISLKYSKLIPRSMRKLKDEHLMTLFSPVIENVYVGGIDGIVGSIVRSEYLAGIFAGMGVIYNLDMQSLLTTEELDDFLLKEDRYPLDYDPFEKFVISRTPE